jgi:hypothetical protein
MSDDDFNPDPDGEPILIAAGRSLDDYGNERAIALALVGIGWILSDIKCTLREIRDAASDAQNDVNDIAYRLRHMENLTDGVGGIVSAIHRLP